MVNLAIKSYSLGIVIGHGCFLCATVSGRVPYCSSLFSFLLSRLHAQMMSYVSDCVYLHGIDYHMDCLKEYSLRMDY